MIVAVLGPTASGKSGLALQLARAWKAEILCVDATTVYRGLDIGTAKPTPAERALVPHHLLDLADPRETYSLAQFQKAAQGVLAQLEGSRALLVGGSHLYLKAILEGYTLPETSPDAEFRSWAQEQPLQDLVAQLGQRDPASLALVDLANPRRVIRALEVCRGGLLFSETYRRVPLATPVVKLGLRAEAAWLEARIRGRVEAMLASGWLTEVTDLVSLGLSNRLRELKVIGYPELLDCLEGSCTREEAVERIVHATLRLVKRQRTWYRKEANVHWLDADDPDLLKRALPFLMEELGDS